jgi:FKBP-type peptidyl-prolyl cis-trans isomerase
MKIGYLRMTGALIGLALCGCEEPPDIQPLSPPGAYVPKVSPDAEAAQAQGETAPTAPTPAAEQTKVVSTKPAPPTAKGETKTTDGGVKYETLKEGTGPELKSGQKAEIHYVGQLEDGKEFDSSRTKTPPAPFEVTIGSGAVIKGWDEAIPGMKVGELRKLTIPPAMAYGKLGKKPQIPPFSTLIFEVELLGIK